MLTRKAFNEEQSALVLALRDRLDYYRVKRGSLPARGHAALASLDKICSRQELDEFELRGLAFFIRNMGQAMDDDAKSRPGYLRLAEFFESTVKETYN